MFPLAGKAALVTGASSKVLTGIAKRLVAGSEAGAVGTPEDVAGFA